MWLQEAPDHAQVSLYQDHIIHSITKTSNRHRNATFMKYSKTPHEQPP